ncbi:hypothetical protein [uncultured Mucilaginibacter sp.]|uniref:hypothetical protein n=1 Tax=uncultured Mucilaginibacter sp. TaxID=797541 RepID=UPI0025D22CB5|nr:hypothetical protein [uncultured Mucilaginibacter sp.]
MEQNPNIASLGFYSADGFFQPLKGLNTSNLEFVSRSLYELEMMLDENVRSERYEKCAQIRDEIIRRAISRM